MAVFLPRSESSQPVDTTFAPFPATPVMLANDLHALIADFFSWLETAWQLPIFSPGTARDPLPIPMRLTEDTYAITDLAQLYGFSYDHVQRSLRACGIFPFRRTRSNGRRRKPHAFFKKDDLAPLIEHWEWKRLFDVLDSWWLPFFPPACGTCKECQRFERSPTVQQMYCSSTIPLAVLRSVFTQFLKEIRRLGGIAAWWHAHHTDTWEKRTRSAWGIVIIYLLDRRQLHLSNDELLQLEPLRNKDHWDLTRLWRNRHPEEYDQFLHAMTAASYKDSPKREQALLILSILVLLKYGLSGIGELGRVLSPEEIQQLCGERRLVTRHLGYGVFIPYPLIADIRVGHVILDDIRHYLWQYAAGRDQLPGRQRWDLGPRCWQQPTVGLIEQALAAPVYEHATGILSRRPETEQSLVSPWHIAHRGKLADNGYALLPTTIQEHIMAYLTYCHQERHMELQTLKSCVGVLLHFFKWTRTQGTLVSYPHWTRQYAQEVFRAYAAHPGIQVTTRYARLKVLATFFSTLAELGWPVPAGYRLLLTLGGSGKWQPRSVPSEEIMDRVFRDGVCHLAYDPFARLALTIQYYCGTRVTETCDLHLFCVLEDREGHAYLLIPRGKSKQERPFPIVELGMGILMKYMEDIVQLRLSEERNSRTLGRTNLRYLDDDPERATDWHYLFDRVPTPDGLVKVRGRLSRARVEQALQEALLIAAKINPDGLFQGETYNSSCQHRRQKRQVCMYFAAQEGITNCPRCGSPLSGRLGARCRHILEEDFICNGVAQHGEAFCPKCDMPLAVFLPITTHVFRHNSVSRAHRAGVPLDQNMKLHGHQTIPMHLRYLHLVLDDTTDGVRQIFADKRLREIRQALGSAPGQIVEGGVAYTISLEDFLGLTLQRALKRRTYGIWGGFWAGALAQRGIASPLSAEDDIVIPEDTYELTVAQYWYEALGLAVSEVAFERVTSGKWRAEVPPFLDRQKIESLVQFHLHSVQDSLGTALGMRLMETDIVEQRRFLDELSDKLRPWWKHLGSIDPLVEMFAPGGGHAFQKQLPSTEPAS